MQYTNIPPKIGVPFGTSGPRNTIPVPSQIGIVDGAASFTDGFPPLTMTDPAAGGVPPDGKDVNGILYALSQAIQWINAGGALETFDSAFATATGGYPYGALVQSLDRSAIWLSTADNNTVNPDTGFGSWVPVVGYGLYSPTLSGSNVTLTPAQASKDLIIILGTLTANVTLTFPLWYKTWTVINACTGSYSVSAKTATGAAQQINNAANTLYCDGANMYNCNFITPTIFQYQQQQFFQTYQSLTTNGYQKLPGGLIMQWGKYSSNISGDGATASVTYPIAFPTGTLNAQITELNPSADTSADGRLSINATPNTGLSVVLEYTGAGASPLVHGFNWFALGY